MRLLTIGALLCALALPATVAASKFHGGCNTHACLVRVAHRQSHDKKVRVTGPYRGWLARLRGCESGGNYGAATGNGFFGAYQFTLRTWWAAGGRGMPHLNPPLEQDYRAVIWRLRIGNPHQPAGWPVCG